METLMLPFSPRFIVLTICAVVTALLLGLGIVDRKVFDLVLIPMLIFGALTLLGIRDLMQKSHAVLRNYPISAHIRFLLEEIRPEMRQYFFESEKDGMPFSRDTRAVIYQRAKMVLDKRPFGTQEESIATAMNGSTIRWRRSFMSTTNFGSASAARIAASRIRHRCSISRR
jgi:glutamate synthase domain-containing protein 2